MLRHGTDFLDPWRFRQHTIQFFRDRRELNRCSNLERLPLTQPKRFRRCVSKLAVQIGLDMAANVLKEFWPDVERQFNRNSRQHAIAQH